MVITVEDVPHAVTTGEPNDHFFGASRGGMTLKFCPVAPRCPSTPRRPMTLLVCLQSQSRKITNIMEEASAPTSKKGQKKAEAKAKKEALKAQRAAELAAAAANVNLEDDPAQDNYGNRQTTPLAFSQGAEEVEIRSLDKSYNGKTVVVRAWLQNSRIQSAKMGFVQLRKGGNWNIQGVVMASEEEPIVSRRMVKWITSINPESYIAIEAKVKEPLEPVKSCRVSGLELHITKCFVIAPAPSMLGMTMETASQPIVNFSDESAKAAEDDAEKAAKATAESTVPAASMLTHLDNIAMHKRAPVQQAIAVCRNSRHNLCVCINANPARHRIFELK